MRFKVGDKIKIYRSGWCGRFERHIGSVGTVIELRTYGRRLGNSNPSHYVVKFDCYKIPHIYMDGEIDECCDKIGE